LILIESKRLKKFPSHTTKKHAIIPGPNKFCKMICPIFFTNCSTPSSNDKKNAVFRWNKDERESFELIKKAIINAPSLTTPDFLKPFVL